MTVEMFEHFSWLPFLVAITALTMSPGVDSLLVIRNAARGGLRDGLLTSLGICLGLFAHATVSALGLSVILLGSATLFAAMKIAGAAYLAWLGIQSLRSAWHARGMQIAAQIRRAVPAATSLREGLLSNVLNPKPIIFYMAFLPQFIDPAYSALLQSLAMAAMHFAIATIWQGLLALMVERARTLLVRPRVSRILDGITGVLLLGFGARLAATQS
ncbi:Homoserine/homoserine lactone efflux protein [Azoarcus sp. Aa7]|nr:Homoserine/homoserine lactone efflux protein [Azoarcus sp. Aa7]